MNCHKERMWLGTKVVDLLVAITCLRIVGTLHFDFDPFQVVLFDTIFYLTEHITKQWLTLISV